LLCLAIASVCTMLGFLQPVVNAFILMTLGVSSQDCYKIAGQNHT
jgi:hypothetical protein